MELFWKDCDGPRSCPNWHGTFAWIWKTGVSLFSLAEELLSGGNSNISYFHLENLGKISNLTSTFFQMGGSNHQLALCLTFFFEAHHQLTFGILRVPLSSNPFHEWIPGIQTTDYIIISWHHYFILEAYYMCNLQICFIHRNMAPNYLDWSVGSKHLLT